MVITLLISLFAVIVTYINRNKEVNYGLEIAFIAITIFSAIRYDYGNDYTSYYSTFNEMDGASFRSLFMVESRTEIGWRFLCLIFQPLGFFSFVAFLSVFENVVFYKLIKKHVSQNWQWFAMFIYLFNSSYFVLQQSMMRQTFAIALFIIATTFIYRKQIIPAIILLLLAFSIHQSAIVLIPFAFIGLIPQPISAKGYLIYISIAVFLFCSNLVSNDILIKIMSAFPIVDNYDSYATSDSAASFGIGFFLLCLFTAVVLYKQKEQEGICRLFSFLFLFDLLILPFTMNILMISRLRYYFSIFAIVAIPNSFPLIKDKALRYIFISLYILISSYNYIGFFNSETWSEHFSVYHTIFEAL